MLRPLYSTAHIKACKMHLIKVHYLHVWKITMNLLCTNNICWLKKRHKRMAMEKKTRWSSSLKRSECREFKRKINFCCLTRSRFPLCTCLAFELSNIQLEKIGLVFVWGETCKEWSERALCKPTGHCSFFQGFVREDGHTLFMLAALQLASRKEKPTSVSFLHPQPH
jgi:hypothetical protein